MLIRSLTQFLKKSYFCEQRCLNYRKMSRIHVLNVAEKNDAAKNIAQLLSRGRSSRVSISRKECVMYSYTHSSNIVHVRRRPIPSFYILICRKRAYQNSTKSMSSNVMLKAMHVI